MSEYDEVYTREELDAFVDYICACGPSICFTTYNIGGIYVSPEVIEQALREKFDAWYLRRKLNAAPSHPKDQS